MTTPPPVPKPTGTMLSRRQMLAMLGALPAAAAVASRLGAGSILRSGPSAGSLRPATATGGTLNVYTWPDYFAPSVLAAFEKQTGITVNISTYDSNSVLFSKLDGPAGTGFDVVVPSSSWVQELATKGLLAKLDHSRLNLSSLSSGLLGRNYDRDNTYSIPKDWGVLGVVYDPVAVGGTIKTWQDFFTAGATPAVTGKVRLSDSAYETIGPFLWIEGHNWNTTNEKLIEQAADKAKAFAKNVKTFESFDPSTMASGSIVLAQTDQSGGRAAIEQTPRLKWVVPGPTSELWVDNYAISAKAPHVDAAYEFLAYQLQLKVQVAQTEYIGYPAAIKGLEAKLPKSTKDVDLIFGGPDLDLSSLTSYIVNPNTAALWEQLQDEIQAAAV